MRLYAYHRSSASYRVRIALEHKQLPFELVPVCLPAREQQTDDYRRRNPLAQVPTLEIEHEDAPVFLAQSLAIIEYLDERYPARPLLPKHPLLRARARELAEIVNAGIQPLQNTTLVRYLREELRVDDAAWVQRVTRRGLEALEARATQCAGRFLVGDQPSVADVFLVPQLYNARLAGVTLEGLETLLTIETRCRELPGWERAHPDRQPDAQAGSRAFV
jgi:maleylpyruvate isomerase